MIVREWAVNKVGRDFIATTLIERHKRFEDGFVSDGFLDAWVSDVINHADENGVPGFELTSNTTNSGHTEWYVLPDDGMEYREVLVPDEEYFS